MKTEEGIDAHVNALFLYDYGACILIGQITENRATESAMREVDRVFGKDRKRKVVGPLVNRMLCIVEIESYESWGESDGSHLIVVFSVKREELPSIFERTEMSISQIPWFREAETFLI